MIQIFWCFQSEHRFFTSNKIGKQSFNKQRIFLISQVPSAGLMQESGGWHAWRLNHDSLMRVMAVRTVCSRAGLVQPSWHLKAVMGSTQQSPSSFCPLPLILHWSDVMLFTHMPSWPLCLKCKASSLSSPLNNTLSGSREGDTVMHFTYIYVWKRKRSL